MKKLNFYLFLTFIACIALVTSCSSPQKARKLYADASIKQLVTSKPHVVKINHDYKPKKQPVFDKNSQYPRHIRKLIKQHGEPASKRIIDWKYTIIDHQRRSEMEKLNIANRFINRLKFIDDKIHWQQRDYWATPLETLASSGGDCEDLAIAKYYMLSKLGIANHCLTLNYVKVRNYNKPHMVLIYQCSENDKPLVLDNLNPQLLSAEQRKDLTPVYGFNHSGMWLTNQLGKKHRLSQVSKLRRWDELRHRVNKEN